MGSKTSESLHMISTRIIASLLALAQNNPKQHPYSGATTKKPQLGQLNFPKLYFTMLRSISRTVWIIDPNNAVIRSTQISRRPSCGALTWMRRHRTTTDCSVPLKKKKRFFSRIFFSHDLIFVNLSPSCKISLNKHIHNQLSKNTIRHIIKIYKK